MGTEVAEPEVIPASESSETDDAEIRAGFNGETDPTPSAAPVASTPDVPQAPVASAPAPSPAPVTVEDQLKDLLAKVTKIDQIEATFNKRFDESFGRIGRLQQVIKEQQAVTPVGKPVELTEEDFKDLKQEFPELTPALLKGLNPALKRLGVTGASSIDEERASAIAQTHANTVRLQVARELLEDQVEGWEQIVGAAGSQSPFRQWLAQQPKEYQDLVSTTYRPGVMAKAIQKFQEATQPSAPEPSSKPKEKPAGAVERQARLAAAVAPQGKPVASSEGAKSAEDEMREGFERA